MEYHSNFLPAFNTRRAGSVSLGAVPLAFTGAAIAHVRGVLPKQAPL